MPYEIVHGRKLKLPIDVALRPLHGILIPAVGNYHIRATCNVARNIAKTTGLGREGQSTSKQSREFLGYPHGRYGTPLYKVSAAEGQIREAVTNLSRSLQLILK